MQYLRSCILLLGMLSYTLGAFSEEVTLRTKGRDEVTINYTIEEKNGQCVIHFGPPLKRLSRSNKEKYSENPAEFKVFFFDKIGGVQNINFDEKSIGTDRFRANKINYQPSEDGWFMLEQEPELRLEVLEDTKISIPIYLAHYKEVSSGKKLITKLSKNKVKYKSKYTLFARCEEDLVIDLKKGQTRSISKDDSKTSPKTRTVTKTQEVEVDGEEDLALSVQTKEEIVKNLIPSLEGALGASVITASMQAQVNRLNELWPEIKDPALKEKCKDILRRYDMAQKTNDDWEKNKTLSTQKREIELLQQEKAQNDINYAQSILQKEDLSDNDLADLRATAQQLQRESYGVKDEELKSQMQRVAKESNEKIDKIEAGKKKRNVWLIVGGVFLVILMFVGNQTFSHFRNVKNQKDLMKMNDTLAKQAKDMATRRAQSLARSKISNVQSKVRKTSRDYVRNGVNSAVNGVTGKKGKGGVTI